jgi:hypothetical protein
MKPGPLLNSAVRVIAQRLLTVLWLSSGVILWQSLADAKIIYDSNTGWHVEIQLRREKVGENSR